MHFLVSMEVKFFKITSPKAICISFQAITALIVIDFFPILISSEWGELSIQQIEIIKSHTCEEGGAHLRISFWHLLMNLKNKIIIKKTVEVDQWKTK